MAAALAALALSFALRPEAVTLPSFAPGDEAAVEKSMMQMPLAFEPNAGRTDARVAYMARTPTGTVFLRKDAGATFTLRESKRSSQAISIGLIGGAAAPEPSSLEQLPGVVNSFIGDDPSKWKRGLPTFERVRYSQVYPGIDLDWYGNQRRLEYDFQVAPGADPDRIALRFGGHDRLRLAANGDLVVGAGSGHVRQKAPVAYQAIDGERQPVDAAFALDGSTVRFRLGAYDRSQPLVIDPLTLSYSTLLGGNADKGGGIAIEPTGGPTPGAAYITGDTTSASFPTLGAIQTHQSTNPAPLRLDAFVTKLNASGTDLVYSTYLGDVGSDFGSDIAVDSTGAAYVTGRGGVPIVDPFQPVGGGNFDVFVAKLTPAGNSLAYSSPLGGGPNGGEEPGGIAVDSLGAAYVTGATFGATTNPFPTQDAFQAANAGAHDVFVTKVNPDPGGTTDATVAYSTLLGGTGVDQGSEIAVDGSGAAYVTGETDSANFPLEDQFAGTSPPGQHSFVTKLDPDPGGTNPITLAYSTFVGGGVGYGIDVDSDGAAYVTGSAGSSSSFPIEDAFQPTAGDSSDAFVTKLRPEAADVMPEGPADDVTLGYSTFLGGTDRDRGFGIAVDSTKAAYVTGETESTNFPTEDAFDSSHNGNKDAFVTKVTPEPADVAETSTADDVAKAYSTYLGGSGFDGGPLGDPGSGGIAVDATGAAYIASQTGSTNFPTTTGAFQETNQGGVDAFVTKFNADTGGTMTRAYSTYLGGADTEQTGGVAVDASGAAYLIGTTDATAEAGAFPTVSCYDCFENGKTDVFVSKFNPAGSGLVYSTYLGGSDGDVGVDIAVEGGVAYLTGGTGSNNFPTTSGAYNTSYNGGGDVFVAKLNAAGNGLSYSTFFGGATGQGPTGIAVESGLAYVVGVTDNGGVPTTAGAVQPAFGGGDSDAFAAKLDPAGTGTTDLVYSTHLGGGGGSGTEEALGIAVRAGEAYVTGNTPPGSTNYPTTAGAFDTSQNGLMDTFVSKINSAGSALVYSTFLGGAATDIARGIAVDGSGAAYVTGAAQSTNFPTTADAFDVSHDGDFNVYAAKLNPAGSSLAYSTYIGNDVGNGSEGIAVDSAGAAYLTGLAGPGFPTTAGAPDTSHNGSNDAFAAKLNPSGGGLVYSTFVGGAAFDRGKGIALGPSGSAYIAGDTASLGFPTTPGAFDRTYDGSTDAFLSKLSFTPTDQDGDGVTDDSDNCPGVANATQTDTDGAGQGDACDPDDDNDTVFDTFPDNCRTVSNPGQQNFDNDALGDACDPDDDNDTKLDTAETGCPGSSNPLDIDSDNDGANDAADAFPCNASESADSDSDGVGNNADNCPNAANPGQQDADNDGIGDACDPLTDSDADGVANSSDNCPNVANANQANADGDSQGDACDSDDDADNVPDSSDNCPTQSGPASNGGCPVPLKFCSGVRATIVGSATAGTINGTAGPDVIVDLGSGTVNGFTGNDLICGNGLRNVLVGGGGRDRLFGLSGRDRLNGGGGSDNLKGGAGNDTLLGGGGRDSLFGQGGNDILRGGGGVDKLRPGGGRNKVRQ
jgi:thrombospondin type 3 repeat protein/beta-propeller repeat-containing protein/hemolysin type calcium-binding protein